LARAPVRALLPLCEKRWNISNDLLADCHDGVQQRLTLLMEECLAEKMEALTDVMGEEGLSRKILMIWAICFVSTVWSAFDLP
jgi:hypothetical protein